MKNKDTFLLIFCLLSFRSSIYGQTLYGTFDFIVVGAGSAGSIIATRLSENSSVKVLVIEAGSMADQMNQDIPLGAVQQQRNPAFDWMYTSVAQPNSCLGMIDQSCAYPRGKGLGGSSQINAMMYVRGNKADYDQWAAEGCTGWDYESLLPYFKRNEGYQPNGQSGVIDASVHGTSGPMNTEFARFRTDYSRDFVEGAKTLGMKEVDYNSLNQIGVSYLQANTEFGRREDTGDEYLLKLAWTRPNFQISLNSHVTKIIFNGKTVTGVLFRKENTTFEALITKELILSAGVINTPQILMLSGIGPAATLEANGIPVLQNLPVGQFMDDHPAFFGPTYTTNSSTRSINFYQAFTNSFGWFFTGSSQLSIPYAIEGLFFNRTFNSTLPIGVPDYELMFTSASMATDKGNYQYKNMRITDLLFNEVYGPLLKMNNDTISAFVMVLHPKSIGNMTISDTNPFSKPLIYPNQFMDPADLDTMLQGLRSAQRILTSEPFKKYNPTPFYLNIPGCSEFPFDSDDHWKCCFKYIASSMYHMVGTCRMGPATDATAVVGPDLRVHGISKLIVCDSSAMRDVNSGHTAAPVMAMAEKLSDMIKAQYAFLGFFFLKSLLMDYAAREWNRLEQNKQNTVNTASYNHYNNHGTWSLLNSYDFIIVGAGSSGCVLASRLSENPDYKVLLIEAGKRQQSLNDIPIFAAYLQSTSYNWNYVTEPQEGACLGMEDQRCAFPRGKGVGGSSLINYMIYNRGNKYDFDQWASMGNEGWSYNEILPYFKKSENNNLKGLENSTYHGKGGPMNTEYPQHRTKYAKAFMEAQKHIGIKRVDYNGESQLGTSYVQANTLHGRRQSAASAFIDPILWNRPNLHILTEARVTKVLIDPDTKEAYGVEYVRFKKRNNVFAAKEVILSAGAFSSPQILMLSGIGQEHELKRIGVPLLQDLPVGKVMYDHLCHFGPTFTVNTSGISVSSDRVLFPHNLKEYFTTGGSPLSIIGGVETLTFIKTPNSRYPATVPDLELLFIPGAYSSDQGTGIKRGMRVTDEIYNSVYKELDKPSQDVFSIMVMQFHPQSAGYLELKDRNPFHWPRFYPNYFKNPNDVEDLLHGIKEAIRIVNTPPFDKFNATIHSTPLPGCKMYDFGTDDYWRCSIRTLSASLHHQVGTTKMGPETDKTAVVSPELKVHGISKLRVVDTGVVPLPPTSHTAAIAMMIGEKAADMIKNDWENEKV
uniref:CSON009341 protein n=2 Tax=Culicoides sonorensis TaxID=179676 RepID=A0A336M2J5_CULSO